ncbi:FAD-dependent oxidoreductase [Microbacterium sp. B35-04]|uniref:FAD-dependent oxidoreductase n=1 Tax=unclassified Microbacterium TaxID=2609290 RepID=UPI0013D46B9D|nr:MULTISPECIES: FAD-dependent oxidoreductase [unclassified Microbacterium]KAF2411579.1 FAD-dependent oxidoreductase [Microbacterium sp. B35-04]KAF2418172.1 FAD-dependent oxidoreductase [Microbacterium sp. B35-30]
MTEHVPFLVVGGGAMGLATTWQLARRGHRVLTLERFERGHALGASHGATRNFNNAYAAGHYLDLLGLARAEWDALAHATGEPLLRLHGLVTHGDDVRVAGTYAALTARGERAAVLDNVEAARRWSGMRFAGDVLFTPDAGVVRAAAALEALERGARARGADVRFGHAVVGLEEHADHVSASVIAGDTRYEITADVVVVTAGAWTSKVLPRFPLPRLTVTEESPAHFAPRDSAHHWPSFNHLLPRPPYPGNVYGMPTPGEGVKVGFHLVGPVVDPDARTLRPVPELAARLRDYVEEWMPGLDPDTASPISCTYTSTDSEDFVLDRRGRVVVGAGFSGHGFKFTPAVGSVLADLATDDTARAARAFRLP